MQAGAETQKEADMEATIQEQSVGHVFKNSLYGAVAFHVVLSYNDGWSTRVLYM